MCITLDDGLKSAFSETVAEFKRNPKDQRYHHEIKFGSTGLYSLFIWSPTETYDCGPIYCEEHGTEITPRLLTDDISVGNRNTNPR